jgi:hypothetical protein
MFLGRTSTKGAADSFVIHPTSSSFRNWGWSNDNDLSSVPNSKVGCIAAICAIKVFFSGFWSVRYLWLIGLDLSADGAYDKTYDRVPAVSQQWNICGLFC